jgi:arylformamidase
MARHQGAMMGTRAYRDYDRAALDAQYNNRARVPDFAAALSAWAASSERARARHPGFRTVQYGPTEAETIDLFPSASSNAPIQVFFHGGYWMALGSRDFSFLADAFAPAGACLAVVNYALIPSVDLDGLIGQCRASIAWLRRHAAEFGGDPERIFVSGNSAGGHIVAMLAETDWRAHALPPDAIKGGIAISGLYDLEPIRACYLNDKLGLDAAAVARNSPIRHARPGGPPLVFAVGGTESEEFHRQTNEFAAVWRAAGNRVAVQVLPGLNHFTITTALGDPSSELFRTALNQMGV